MKRQLSFKVMIFLVTLFVSIALFSLMFRNWVAVKEIIGSLF